jgi:hypothetical protein
MSSEDCKGRRISIGSCDIRNSYKITADGVLQNVLECEICGKREVELFTDKHPITKKYHKGET